MSARRGVRAAAAALAAFAVTAGCGGPAPETMALVSGAGQPLPAPLIDVLLPGAQGPERYRVVATGGELALDPWGRYRLELALEVSVDGHRVPPAAWRDRGAVARRGSSLTLTSEVVVARAYRGERTRDGAVLRFDLGPLLGVDRAAELGFTSAPP